MAQGKATGEAPQPLHRDVWVQVELRPTGDAKGIGRWGHWEALALGTALLLGVVSRIMK